MGKAAIIQVLCADAPGRQACRWRAPAEGNIEGFPDELDISWGVGGENEFHPISACKEFSLNGWDDRQVNCDGAVYRAGREGRKIRGDVLDMLQGKSRTASSHR